MRASLKNCVALHHTLLSTVQGWLDDATGSAPVVRMASALLPIIKEHAPANRLHSKVVWCSTCDEESYPCPTISGIEKEVLP